MDLVANSLCLEFRFSRSSRDVRGTVRGLAETTSTSFANSSKKKAFDK